jgi:hypothetical protein
MAAAEPSYHPHYVRSEELGNEITELCAYINAATHELLLKVHEFDHDKLWVLDGICSCAHWLNWKCGIGINAAREKVRVATTDNEDFLLNIAHHGTAHHVERTISQYRRVVRRHESPIRPR